MDYLETNVVSVFQREASGSEAGGWEDKVEVSSGAPSQKKSWTKQGWVSPEAPHEELTLPTSGLGTSGAIRAAKEQVRLLWPLSECFVRTVAGNGTAMEADIEDCPVEASCPHRRTGPPQSKAQ